MFSKGFPRILPSSIESRSSSPLSWTANYGTGGDYFQHKIVVYFPNWSNPVVRLKLLDNAGIFSKKLSYSLQGVVFMGSRHTALIQ